MGHVADEADSQVWQHTEQCACHASSLKFMFLLIMEKCSAISLSGKCNRIVLPRYRSAGQTSTFYQ